MNPIILIPARLAATRLPEKPLADIAGKPMIVHVLERALASNIGPVWVACDDARIEKAVKAAGGQVVLTRSDHPSGSDRIYEALQRIDPEKHYDVVINLQGDVPTVEPAVIRAVNTPLSDPEVDIATLACEITRTEERNDASVVKIAVSFPSPLAGEGQGGGRKHSALAMSRALYFSRAAIPTGEGPLHHHIGIYAYRRKALERFIALGPSPLELREKLEQLRALEAGMRIDVALVDTVPLGVDTPEHLERARRIVAGGQ